jgi:hypothetical protein
MNGMNNHNHVGTAPVVLQHDNNYCHRQITISTNKNNNDGSEGQDRDRGGNEWQCR